MCREFLDRLAKTLGSKGGAVRLVEQDTGKVHLYIQQGLSAQLVKDEACIDRGQCLCGEAARDGASVIRMFTGYSGLELPEPARRIQDSDGVSDSLPGPDTRRVQSVF